MGTWRSTDRPAALIEPEPGSDVKDARQVRTWAAALQRVDSEGNLARHLSAAGDMPVAVREEEAAILGMDYPAAFQRMVPGGESV